MTKVFDLLRSLGWYIVNFIYKLIDTVFLIVKKLNVFDIIGSLSNNQVFVGLYKGIMAIAVTLFALFIVWRFINKLLDQDEENSFRNIMIEIMKCGALIMMSTFLFVQVSNFSIKLSNYTGNIFESSTNQTMSDSMLTMFISYNDDYKNSDKFNESKSISDSVSDGSFNSDELYISKYVTKSRVILSDEKDYKYDINWILAILCGGFFLYSLFFASIMLGRRQIEFLFLFLISPIVFATSICNKQRRGAVIEQLVSLTLQSSVVMLIVSLSVMVMQEVNNTTFFSDSSMNVVAKVLLYLGCGTFILTGSQVINRFIGANVSAASGREQLMSLMGYGKVAGTAGAIAGATALGGGLLATGGVMKAGGLIGSNALSKVGATLGAFGAVDTSSGARPTRMQKIASTLGTKMYMAGQNGLKRDSGKSKFSPSNAFINAGASSLNSAIRTVVPRASYNTAYYRRRKSL
ncbi:MAG: hypothetical protein IJ565_02580 [Bacilli bacterium]|nr:hypothetical protein [Bacilli bacterium]